MKSPFVSKTVLVGALEILIGVLGLLGPFLGAGDYSAPAVVLLVSGALKIVLRFMTSESIGFE